MVTMTPLNTMLDRMVTLSRAMDQAWVNGAPETLGKTAAQPAWVPALDAWETEAEYVVQLDLPGVNPEKVEINFEKNTLSIRGERERGIVAPDKGELRVFFAERDRAWEQDDPAYFSLSDALQHLGNVAFRAPVPAYKHSAAVFLKMQGRLPTDLTHPNSPSRPSWERDILADCAHRLGLPIV